LGQECLYNTATFSQNAKYFVLECNGPEIPKIELRKTEDNSVIMTLQTNEQLKNNLENKLLPKIEKLSVNIEGYSKL
jgi:dipeptidyl-peptidase-4